MFDKGQLAGLMKKAQEMQKNLEKAQEEVSRLEVEGESGAGMVKVIMTGKHDLKKVTIDESVMDDKEMLEDLIAAAVNDANRKVEEQSQAKMGSATAGMPAMPGGFKFPF
ncbi:MAG: YbaB/EbfC family nucleoid-associated protein [Burkholderiales bacterium]|jgi:DNA-binding YbaB/EbfC family protein|nr:YbaB/EbfC family nucleoid-associated protein [Burkholderiales bacterium]